MNFVNTSKQLYNPTKIDLLHKLLLNSAKNNRPLSYEIHVNDFTVIHKTNDHELFESFSEFIDETSDIVKIFIYRYNLNVSDKYFFYINEGLLMSHTNKNNGVSGIEQKAEIEDRIKKELHLEKVEEENNNLKLEVKELEDALAECETEKETIKNNRDLNFSGMAAIALNGIAQTEMGKKIISGLGGLGSTEKSDSKLTEEQETFLELLKLIHNKVPQDKIEVFQEIINGMIENPQTIFFLRKMLKNYLNTKKKPES